MLRFGMVLYFMKNVLSHFQSHNIFTFTGMAAYNQLFVFRSGWVQLLIQHDIFVSFLLYQFIWMYTHVLVYEGCLRFLNVLVLKLSVIGTGTVECWRRGLSEAGPLTLSLCFSSVAFSWQYPSHLCCSAGVFFCRCIYIITSFCISCLHPQIYFYFIS